MANERKCSTNGTKGLDVLNVTGLTAGTNYTFHVYTVWQGVLSDNATTIQSFTSKKSFQYRVIHNLCHKHMHIHGKYLYCNTFHLYEIAFKLKIYKIQNTVHFFYHFGYWHVSSFSININVNTFAGPLQVSSAAIKHKSNSTLTLVWEHVKTESYSIEWHCTSPNTNQNKVFNQNVSDSTTESSILDPGSFCNVVIKAFINNFDHGVLNGSALVTSLNESTLEEGLLF